jgi:large subunit ribosomal protein L19
MASKLLPQALIITPTRNPRQRPPTKLGFTTCISRRPSSFNSGTHTSTSRVSTSSIGWNLSPVVADPSKRSFIVRAESNSEAEVTENVEDNEAVDDVEEESSESEAEVKSEEAKPPRKPRVKLGDIMGVIIHSDCFFFLIMSVWFSRKCRKRKLIELVEIKLKFRENWPINVI